jgi:hypothetical protein
MNVFSICLDGRRLRAYIVFERVQRASKQEAPMQVGNRQANVIQAIEVLSFKIGVVLLALWAMRFVKLRIVGSMRRRAPALICDDRMPVGTVCAAAWDGS